MQLHVSDRSCLDDLEQKRNDQPFSYSKDEKKKLAIKVAQYIETVLNYNPDATEQIDIQDKHLSNAETLGEQTCTKIDELTKHQYETCKKLSQAMLEPYPSWFKSVFTHLDHMLSQLDPTITGMNSKRMKPWIIYIPVFSSLLRKKFSVFKKSTSHHEKALQSLGEAIHHFESIKSELESQFDELQSLSKALHHTIEFGRLIKKGLSLSLKTDIPMGDPRIEFILNRMIPRFKKRIKALKLQYSTNQKSLSYLDIHVQNCKELVHGLDQTTQIVVQLFNQAAECGSALLDKKTMQKIWPDMPYKWDQNKEPEEMIAQLKQILTDLQDITWALKSFSADAGPELKHTLDDKNALEKKTFDTLDAQRILFLQAYQRDLVEYE